MSLTLEPWDESGFEILQRCNVPEMTIYLGGPETVEKLAERQRRYLNFASTGRDAWPLRVLLGGEAVGSVTYWDDTTAFEMGWAIAPEYQGRGLARASVDLALDHAAANGLHPTVTANPSVTNVGSNAVARSAGFQLQGEHEIEYPVGTLMLANLWSYDLSRRDLSNRGSSEREHSSN
jgi:RimJ/RimL family protein N-acetyltransferase